LRGVAVESTYNWYWLVDGPQDAGFALHLVNTAAVKQYDGLKYSGDFSDARHLAHLLRLGILPTGYIYPREERAVRDLLRKRGQLVRQRSTQILSMSMSNLLARNLGSHASGNDIKHWTLAFFLAVRFAPAAHRARVRGEIACAIKAPYIASLQRNGQCQHIADCR
jgi:transposase